MTKVELKRQLHIEKQMYPCFSSKKAAIFAFFCHDRDFIVFRYIKLLRMTEYYYKLKNKRAIYYIPYVFYKNIKNRLGQKIGLDIGENALGEGVFIAHTDIIVGSASVGKHCKLHGQNCIGSGAVLGDGCELWVGAKVFGPARLANNITVAAGAVVISSFDEEGITVAGVPAKKIK